MGNEVIPRKSFSRVFEKQKSIAAQKPISHAKGERTRSCPPRYSKIPPNESYPFKPCTAWNLKDTQPFCMFHATTGKNITAEIREQRYGWMVLSHLFSSVSSIYRNTHGARNTAVYFDKRDNPKTRARRYQ